MNLRFVLVGNPHSSELEALYATYAKRLQGYGTCRVDFVKERKLPKKPAATEIRKALEAESEDVLASLSRNDYLIALDVRGIQYDSNAFASFFKDVTSEFPSIVFVIGSSYGLGDGIRKRAGFLWKLSALTFTHPLTLLVAMEQVFRAIKAGRGETYSK